MQDAVQLRREAQDRALLIEDRLVREVVARQIRGRGVAGGLADMKDEIVLAEPAFVGLNHGGGNALQFLAHDRLYPQRKVHIPDPPAGKADEVVPVGLASEEPGQDDELARVEAVFLVEQSLGQGVALRVRGWCPNLERGRLGRTLRAGRPRSNCLKLGHYPSGPLLDLSLRIS